MNTKYLREIIAEVVPDAAGCWPWPRSLDPDGYGRYSSSMAHRVVFELLREPIALGHELDHLCRNRACINPDHLEPVTPAENRRRQFAAMTACRRGHDHTPQNTKIYKGFRTCRECNRLAVQRYRLRRIGGAA